MATKIFPAVWDTFIRKGDNDVTHEGESPIRSIIYYGEVRAQPLIKFDCSSDQTSVDKIVSVNIVLSVQNGPGVLHRVYPVNKAATDQCTWNKYDTGLYWTNEGAFAVPQDRSSTQLTQKALVPDTLQYLPVSAADYVAWRTASKPLIFVPDSSGDYQTTIHATGSEGQYWPKIVMEYIPPTRAMYILGG